ncbi:MAG: PAS domain S-box protein, partial [Prolixibacteraceae bacterium]|nr:PAS domain S-box protein [Prolixibacteraceae bacterium]
METFKTSRENIIGKTPAFISPLYQPDGKLSAQHTKIRVRNALNGEPQLSEFKHKTLEGSLFDVEVSLNRIDIDKEIFILAVVRDLTEQKKTTELARKLTAAVEQSSNSIVITDNTGVMEYANPKFTELTGYSYHEIIGKKPNIFKLGYLSEEEYSVMWKAISAGKTWKGEFKNINKNGELYWEFALVAPVISKTGSVTHFVIVKNNITERKKMEQLLKASEQKYRAIYENLIDVFYVVGLDGTIMEISPSFNTYLNLDRKDYIGQKIDNFYSDPNKRKNFINLLISQGSVIDYELVFNLNNEKIYCSANARLIFDENGKPDRVEGMLRNITERKRIEEQIRINEKRFRKAQEVGKIGTFEHHIEKGFYWGSDEAKKILGLDIDSDIFT